jgi:hypothetical protein
MGAEEELIVRASAMVESQVHILSPEREERLLVRPTTRPA